MKDERMDEGLKMAAQERVKGPSMTYRSGGICRCGSPIFVADYATEKTPKDALCRYSCSCWDPPKTPEMVPVQAPPEEGYSAVHLAICGTIGAFIGSVVTLVCR